MSFPTVVYVHEAVEPDAENEPLAPHGELALATPTLATIHNAAKPAAADNPTTQPRTPANNKPNLRAPQKNIANTPNPGQSFGRLNDTEMYLTPPQAPWFECLRGPAPRLS